MLHAATGWTVVAVPGLVPDGIFFEHLAQPAVSLDLLHPDAGADGLSAGAGHLPRRVRDHVPLLVNPVFADYMEAYGKGGLKALGQDALHYLARLYWYTVEFGLIQDRRGHADLRRRKSSPRRARASSASTRRTRTGSAST